MLRFNHGSNGKHGIQHDLFVFFVVSSFNQCLVATAQKENGDAT